VEEICSEVKIVKIKLAGIFTAFICLAMVTGAFAATPNDGIHVPTTKTINLIANPSTGYHWVANYNKSEVILVKQSFKPIFPRLVGGSGIETFVFSGVKGSKIVLKYVKSGDDKPAKTVTYTL
jgi:predicted secreted protein